MVEPEGSPELRRALRVLLAYEPPMTATEVLRRREAFRVAPLAEHAPQERNPLLPRDFTLPRIEDEDD